MENYAYSAGVDMKEHFCPVENTLITYENQCNWCGEKEESMTQDEIMEMARQAGLEVDGVYFSDAMYRAVLVRFAHLVATKDLHPPQRTWVGLEGEEIRNLWEESTKPDRSTMTMITSFARAIESKLKELNT